MDLLDELDRLTVGGQYNEFQNEDVVMSDLSDVSMKDYVVVNGINDEPDYRLQPQQDEESNIIGEEKKGEEKDANKQEISDNISGDQSFQSDAKALVTAILHPESQGFKLATNHQSTNVEKSNSGQYIIHNHFYNNVFSYPSENSMSQRLVLDNSNTDNFASLDEDEEMIDRKTPQLPHNHTFFVLDLIKQSLNYSIALFFLILLFKNLKSDVLHEYQRLEHMKALKIDQCKKEYIINKCDDYGQLPALKDQCLEWSLCFSDEFHPETTTFYTELAFKIIGNLINGFLETLGNMNKAFLVILIFFWYFGNFICGYYKGNQSSSVHHSQSNNQSNELQLKKIE